MLKSINLLKFLIFKMIEILSLYLTEIKSIKTTNIEIKLTSSD